jgi:hypothetical protein
MQVELFFNDVADLIEKKNGDYASTSDVFAGFNEVAKSLNLPFEMVWAVFFSKQVRAVMSHCSGKPESAESIESRLQDIAAYVALLRAWIYDSRGY